MSDVARGNTIVRLSRRADFERLRAEGLRWRGGGLAATFRPATAQAVDSDAHESAAVRFATAMSRTQGNAVARNRCRRRVREALRAHCSLLAPGDYLVRMDARVGSMSFASLVGALDSMATWSWHVTRIAGGTP